MNKKILLITSQAASLSLVLITMIVLPKARAAQLTIDAQTCTGPGAEATFTVTVAEGSVTVIDEIDSSQPGRFPSESGCFLYSLPLFPWQRTFFCEDDFRGQSALLFYSSQ